jgi:hypothetical protein
MSKFLRFLVSVGTSEWPVLRRSPRALTMHSGDSVGLSRWRCPGGGYQGVTDELPVVQLPVKRMGYGGDLTKRNFMYAKAPAVATEVGRPNSLRKSSRPSAPHSTRQVSRLPKFPPDFGTQGSTPRVYW